jgi:cytoskeletal protein RodZ
VDLKMKNFLKGKLVTGVVIIATVILAGVAIFTAMRLYSLRKEGVAPTAPESKPAASQITETQEETATCELLTFNINKPTLSPTDEPVSTPTPGPTNSPTPTDPPRGGTSPTPTDTPSEPTPTSAPQNTPTPTTAYIAAVSPTPAGATLPNAGLSFPSVITFLGGILVIFIALILAL